MKRTTLALASICAATLLTACGGGDDDSGDAGDSPSADAGAAFTDQTGDEIAAAAKDVMAGLDSLRVVGEVTSDGTVVALDLAVAAGGNCTGTVTLDSDPVEVVASEGTVWIKAQPDFWRNQVDDAAQAEQVIEATEDKWVMFPKGESGFEDFCDLDSIVGDDDDEETYEKGEIADVDGTDAIAVTSTDQDGETSIGYVQVEGEHYLLRVENEGEQPGTITLSDFDTPVEVEVPAEADVYDLATGG